MVSLTNAKLMLGQFKTIAFYVGGIFIIGMMVITILNSVFFGISTGNWNPLLDNTAGRLIASETYIKNAMNVLSSNENLPFDYAGHLKSNIITNLLYMAVFIYLIIYKFWKWIVGMFTSESGLTGGMKILIMAGIILLTLLTFTLAEFGYNRYALDMEFKESLPFTGLYSMYEHREAFENYGSLTDSIFSVGIGDYKEVKASEDSTNSSSLPIELNAISMLTTY